MLAFLKEKGISDTTISLIKKYNDDASILDLKLNADECLKIITYMQENGFNCLDNLLIYYLNIFLDDYDDFIKKIGKLNIPYFIKCVNEDLTTIEFLYD